MSHVFLNADRAEYVRRLKTSTGAGGAAGNSAVFDGHNQTLTLDAGERDVQVADVALLLITINDKVREVLPQVPQKSVT